MQTSCYENNCPAKNESPAVPVEQQLCSKKCACYILQKVTDLKTNLSFQCETLSNLTREPEWNINLTKSEEQLVPLNTASSSSTSSSSSSTSSSNSARLVRGVLARELSSRKRDLADMNESRTYYEREAEHLNSRTELLRNRLNEANDVLKSAETTLIVAHREGVGGNEVNGDERSSELAKLFTRSKERRQRIREIHDALEYRLPEVIPNFTRDEDMQLDRAALKLAVDALRKIDSEDLQQQLGSRDVSTLVKFDEDDDGSACCERNEDNDNTLNQDIHKCFCRADGIVTRDCSC